MAAQQLAGIARANLGVPAGPLAEERQNPGGYRFPTHGFLIGVFPFVRLRLHPARTATSTQNRANSAKMPSLLRRGRRPAMQLGGRSYFH
jgi:hypothetical protein